jgi:hypothetical protein
MRLQWNIWRKIATELMPGLLIARRKLLRLTGLCADGDPSLNLAISAILDPCLAISAMVQASCDSLGCYKMGLFLQNVILRTCGSSNARHSSFYFRNSVLRAGFVVLAMNFGTLAGH